MTIEELEEEAKQSYFNTTTETQWSEEGAFEYTRGYQDGAEPREKQIQINAEQIRALQKQNGELTDKVKELEAQIEKMKCCYNCKHSRTEYEHCKTDKSEKWELKEK